MNSRASNFPWGIVESLERSSFFSVCVRVHVFNLPSYNSVAFLRNVREVSCFSGYMSCSKNHKCQGWGEVAFDRLPDRHNSNSESDDSLKSFYWFFKKCYFPYYCFCSIQPCHQRKTWGNSGNYCDRVIYVKCIYV